MCWIFCFGRGFEGLFGKYCWKIILKSWIRVRGRGEKLDFSAYNRRISNDFFSTFEGRPHNL